MIASTLGYTQIVRRRSLVRVWRWRLARSTLRLWCRFVKGVRFVSCERGFAGKRNHKNNKRLVKTVDGQNKGGVCSSWETF